MGKFANVEKMLELSLENWGQATSQGLTRIRIVESIGNKVVTDDGHRFINMVSCSYLGLDRHPKIVEGAASAVRREGRLVVSTSRTRIGVALLDQVEAVLSEVFGAPAITTLSCAVASAGVLPVLASGYFTGRRKPLMIFDKKAHFSMNFMKATCGDETEVVTCEHNDLDFIEDACKRYPAVAYVADGAYSLGGNAPVADLVRLQERYGLFLYFDDSHSVSVYGPRGRGFVRSQLEGLSDRTIIVASLGKAFGAMGGLILLGDGRQRELLDFVGPMSWSQTVNIAGLGAMQASAELHLSDELQTLQQRLRSVLAQFDASIPTENAGNGLPIRVIDLPSVETAVAASGTIFRRGFYSSAVFFPIVGRGRAGLRVMGRADLEQEDIVAFCDALKAVGAVSDPGASS
jgi:7-keto-8-aminopelargonate synthetase-like enzyme